MSYLEMIRLFRKPSPLEVAAEELREAQLKLLEANSGLDYATSMVQYNQLRVSRLTSYIKDEMS